MPDHFPFSYRVVLLVGLMLVVSLVDFYRRGAEATKFREYGFILITGVVGGVMGFGNDLITSSISPEYFILGKGLEEGPNLRMEAGLFGLRVGFSAGVIGGAICMFVTRRKTANPPVKYSRLFGMLWMPVSAAIFCAVVVPWALFRFDPARFTAQLGALLDAERISRFRQVWWIHMGLYAGTILGLAAMTCRAVRERKTPALALQGRAI